MNFELGDEQRQLADSVRRYLGDHYGFEQRKAIVHGASGCSEEVWQTFAEMGVLAFALPESDGGFGGGALDLMATIEACGEALVVEPLLDNIAFGTRLLARLASQAQRAQLLPGLADGSRRVAFAYLEPGRRYSAEPATVTARQTPAGWTIHGRKLVVIGAPQAHTLLVSARTAAGPSVFVVNAATAGVKSSASRTADGQRCADLAFDNVSVSPDALLGADGAALPAIEAAIDFATALACADAVGAMRDACAATLDYTKTRKQFGVPIASFQVLQHRMVEMQITFEQAYSMAILAAARVDGDIDARERSRAVSGAKVKIADAARQISQEAVQLHGGMGMTEELKISHTFRRLTMLAQRFGDADHHLARYAATDAGH